ncbi:hypothetical protein ACFQ8W_00170 [Streptomyces sp. NPDC056508]|uniref:hypothetical protein n=1 Tax=Streptomyces sp. NPDC056508 TaxID=3345845 RepID=UPI0036A60219
MNSSFNIEPRGTVYGTSGYRQWKRVINGSVYHFELSGPSDYWRTAATVRVRRHPYGKLSEITTVHRRMELTEYTDGMEDTSPCQGDRGHFLVARCMECNAARLSKMSPDRVADTYHVGNVSQDEFEAYMYAWATSTVRHSAGGWATPPTNPDVVRIVAAIRRHAGIPTPVGLVA